MASQVCGAVDIPVGREELQLRAVCETSAGELPLTQSVLDRGGGGQSGASSSDLLFAGVWSCSSPAGWQNICQ